MGFASAPSSQEVERAFADVLDGETVAAYVIGQGYGGRAAIVATPTRVLVLTVGIFKLKANLVMATIPLAEAEIQRRGLKISVGKHKLKLGMADNGRAQALADYVASH